MWPMRNLVIVTCSFQDFMNIGLQYLKMDVIKNLYSYSSVITILYEELL